MATRQIPVQRFSVTSSKSFAEVVAGLDSKIGHPDMKAFVSAVAANTSPELEAIVHRVLGPSELMEFIRFDLGAVVRKEEGKAARQSVRLVAGNPLIMKPMLEHGPDAGSSASVTILIDERADGVHLSYDRMASFLAPHANEEALKVARDLDSKVESLLTAAAA